MIFMQFKVFMDVEQMEMCLNKFNMYREQEQLLNEDMGICFEGIKHNYNSDNGKKIDGLVVEITNKLKTISEIHTNNEKVIEKAVERYKVAGAKVNKEFDNIELGDK